jgi:hypothetical protein
MDSSDMIKPLTKVDFDPSVVHLRLGRTVIGHRPGRAEALDFHAGGIHAMPLQPLATPTRPLYGKRTIEIFWA